MIVILSQAIQYRLTFVFFLRHVSQATAVCVLRFLFNDAPASEAELELSVAGSSGRRGRGIF
jgi:hypothetical protein